MPAYKTLKVAIIGGGSISWSPVFLKDLCKCDAMTGGTVVLYDRSVQSLEVMARFAKVLLAERGADLKVVTTTDYDQALEGADYVVNTVLIGSQEVWRKELELILSYGIAHPKGMSVGPGGMAMGIKQIPFIIDLAQRMERLCPKAWLLNFSNPMQLVMLAVQRYVPSIKSIGMCHGLDHTIEKIAGRLGLPAAEISFTAGGVNHFEMITRLQHHQEDLFPRLVEKLESDAATTGYTGEAITLELFKLFGAYPSNHDIHVIEFLPYYIRKGTRLEDWNQSLNRVEKRMEDRETLWHKVQEYIEGKRPLSDFVEEKTTEKLADIIDGTSKNRFVHLYANVTNNGYIRNLSDNICVGVPIVLDEGGWMGCCIGELPQGAAALHNLHGAVQNLVLKGGVDGDRKALLEALSLDPMCYTLSVEERRTLIEKLLEIDKEMLPRFFA